MLVLRRLGVGVTRYRRGDLVALYGSGPDDYEIARVTFVFWRFVRVRFLLRRRFMVDSYRWSVDHSWFSTKDIAYRVAWSFVGWIPL